MYNWKPVPVAVFTVSVCSRRFSSNGSNFSYTARELPSPEDYERNEFDNPLYDPLAVHRAGTTRNDSPLASAERKQLRVDLYTKQLDRNKQMMKLGFEPEKGKDAALQTIRFASVKLGGCSVLVFQNDC